MTARTSILSLCAALLLGCDVQQERVPQGQGVASRELAPGAISPAPASRERQAAFLNRLRSADPQHKTIEKAVLNERNELALILSRSVEMDSIPRMMKTVLTQMAREFPGEDLTVIVYTPTEPPIRVGTAKLDARTREMTYTPVSKNNLNN